MKSFKAMASVYWKVAVVAAGMSLTSCSSQVLVYGGASQNSSSASYSPKAKELKKGEHIVSGQYATQPYTYFYGDENQHFGQVNYTFAYRWSHLYANLNANIGGGRYRFNNDVLMPEETYYSNAQLGFEVGGYTTFAEKFTWRYVQFGVSFGSEIGDYTTKLRAVQDELEDLYPEEGSPLLYVGPATLNLSLSTELAYQINNESTIGIQLGLMEENFARINSDYGSPFGLLYYEYGKFGAFYRMGPYMDQSTVGLYYRL